MKNRTPKFKAKRPTKATSRSLAYARLKTLMEENQQLKSELARTIRQFNRYIDEHEGPQQPVDKVDRGNFRNCMSRIAAALLQNGAFEGPTEQEQKEIVETSIKMMNAIWSRTDRRA